MVDKIRARIPAVSLTSDFIAGFCGETDEEHAATISLMRRVGYTYCFMYAYSMREKTRAYHRLADDVPAHVKAARYQEMLDTFRQTSTQLNKWAAFNFVVRFILFDIVLNLKKRSKIGQIHLVLVDQVSKRSSSDLSGRNDNNSLVVFPNTQELPIVDSVRMNQSTVCHRRSAQIGDYVACRLLSATSQSFKAEPLFICKLQSFHSIIANSSSDIFNLSRNENVIV